MLTRNSQIETRRAPASVSPKSYDPATRSFEAIISTGAPVQRRDVSGPYTERLDLMAIDPVSLKGIPVLTEHSSGNFDAHVGTIESARIVQGNLVASIRLTSAANADVAAQKIQDGILHSLSIGYSVSHWTDGKDPQTGSRVRTAKSWEILEVSLVAMPADKGATVRGAEMPNTNIETKPIVPDAGVIAHRAAVRDIATRSGLDSSWADTQIDSGAEIASVKAAAHDHMIARSQTIRVQQIGPSGDDPAILLQRRIDGLHSQVTGATPKPEAREFAYDSLSEHLRQMLLNVGVSTRTMGKAELMQRAAMNVTSDFTALLTGVGQRSLMPAYEAARSPLVKIFRKQSRIDFRAAYDLRISEMSALQKITEAGEIRAVGRTELSTSYLMDTYAGMFTLSRKAMINDDLGAFADSARAFGQAAALTEAGLMVALLESNPVMAEDGLTLFHATHGNLAGAGITTGEPFVPTLSAGRQALREMKGLDGKTPIAVTPKYLIVNAATETTAESVLTLLTPHTVGDVNPFGGGSNKLELLVDPRLKKGPNSWYMAADPSQVPCLSYAVLGGSEAPTVEVQNLFDTLGTSVRAYHDFGVGASDFRGLYKNNGAA
jgi:HK97 family phage prohead protease